MALNEDVVACERRFLRQCFRVALLAQHEALTAGDEMLLASYMTSLVLLRAQRDALVQRLTACAERPYLANG